MKLNKVYNDIRKFNKIAGKSPIPNDWEQKKNQLARVLEEVKETINAIKNKDKLELLDGFCDILYTALYLGEMLKADGIDVQGAIEEVCMNNLSKFTYSFDFALISYNNYVSIGADVYIGQDEETSYYFIKRRSDDKVMKLINYKSPNLKKFLRNQRCTEQ